MLPGRCKNAIIISKSPIIQTGLKGIMQGKFSHYELTYCRSVEELTLLQLRCADLVIADLTGDCNHPRAVCEQYYFYYLNTVIFTGYFSYLVSFILWRLNY